MQEDWIEIKSEEDLPKPLEIVLVQTNTSLTATPAMRTGDTWLYYSYSSGTFSLDKEPHIKVEHWRKMPLQPKELEHKKATR